MNHHHPAYPDRLLDDPMLFPQGVSPPPHVNNLHSQLRRAVAASALRRERNNSNQSDELSVKRHRIDNGILGNNNGSNNNSPDVANQMPQITATDFSTSNIKHNNNNNNSVLNNNSVNHIVTPPIKDMDRQSESGRFSCLSHRPEHSHTSHNTLAEFNLKTSSIENTSGNANNRDSLGNNGSSAAVAEKESHSSLTPSPRMSGEDVKSEPMELVCGGGGGNHANSANNSNNNNSMVHDDHSNDSVNENEINHSRANAQVKGHLR